MEGVNRLLGELIGLARATDGNEHLISDASTAVIVDCLVASLEPLPQEKLEVLLRRIDEEKHRMTPDCFACAAPCGKNNAYDMGRLQREEPRTREAKLRLLAGIQQMAVGGCTHKAAERFLYKALIVIGMEDFGPEFTESVIQEMKNL